MNERDRLRRVFEDLHRADDAPAPPYRSLAVGSARPQKAGAMAWAARAAVVAAAAAGALVLALWLRSPTGDDETLRLAASLGHWQTPTDFLLRTPGAEFLESVPRLGAGTETVPGDPRDLLQDDSNETEVFE